MHDLPRRVILHLDLDAFYCQVEQKRCSIPRDTPCAVQQWNGLIAVNYAARAGGITRHMRVAEALKKLPELQLVHVQTIGNIHHHEHHHHQQQATAKVPGDAVTSEARPSSPSTSAPASAGTASAAASSSGAGADGSALDRSSAKACLNRYRRASGEIMSLLARHCPGCPLEKASIDEAYLDVTALAARELAVAEAADGEEAGGLPGLLAAAAGGSVVLGEGGLQPDREYDRLAAAGAVVASRLRRLLLEELDYTASAGIAHNKLLAKIGSAMHKPNQQTLVLPRAVSQLMQDLPLGKVKGLGGKLGNHLEQLGAATAGAVAALSWEHLLSEFDSKARWLFNVVRGIDDEPVTPKDKTKSLTSAKSFAGTRDLAVVRQWCGVLAAELADRLEEDAADHHRHARTLVVQYRGGDQTGSRDGGQSIRGAMPAFNPRGHPSADVIAAAAFALFSKVTPPWPLNRLAITATDFVELGSGSGAAMARFLAAGSEQQKHRQQQQQQQQQEQEQQPADEPLSPAPQVARQHQQQQQPEPRTAAVSRSSDASHGPNQTQLLMQAQAHCLPLAAGQAQQQPAASPNIIELAAAYTVQAAAVASSADTTAATGQESAAAAAAGEGCTAAAPAAPSLEGGGLSGGGMAAAAATATAAVDADDMATMAGVDVAEQARILRDIEIRGMQQRAGTKRKSTGGSSSSKAAKKGRAVGQSAADGKQLSITTLLSRKNC